MDFKSYQVHKIGEEKFIDKALRFNLIPNIQLKIKYPFNLIF